MFTLLKSAFVSACIKVCVWGDLTILWEQICLRQNLHLKKDPECFK